MTRIPRGLLLTTLLSLLLPLFAACAPAGQAPAPTAPPPTPPPTLGPLSGSGSASGPVAAASPRIALPPLAGQQGGAYTEAETSDAVSFHPYLTTDVPSSSYQGLIYGGEFWRYNPETLQPEPDAAESWTISTDKTTYTFKLRGDLKWSDGQPLTSADYKFAYEQAIKPEHNYPYVSNLELIKSYEAPDPQTVVITLNEAITVGLEASTAVTPLPKHIWQNLDWSDPSENPEIMAPSVSSGPFKLKEWKRDNYAIFEANDLYYGGRPRLDTYTVRIVPSQEIAYQMLKKGEVDSAPLTPDNYADAKAQPNLTMYEWWPAAAQWNYLGFNLRRPWFKDVNVRHALSYAIDRKAIAERILNNLAQPTHSVFPPTSWVYNPDVPKYEYNPDQARQLLDAAGLKPGPDGLRQFEGKPLKLRILFGPVQSKPAERIATVTQQWLRDVGVDSEITGLEWGAYLSALKSEPFDWDLNVGAWRSTIEPHWMNQIWREDAIPELNHVGYVNKKVEELFVQGSKEFDVQKRKAIYGQIQQIIAEDSPYIFLTYSMSYRAINSRIGGIKPTRLGIGYNIEDWYVKQ